MKGQLKSLLGAKPEGSTSPPLPSLPTEITKLNDGLYELHKPPNGVPPSVEIVFFHGILHFGSYRRPFIDTWTSLDGSTPFCWPMKFLAEDFPEARILSACYDSSITEGDKEGRIDLYCTAENLIQDLTGNTGKVANTKDCPLILVGQDFGGLIIKAVCCKANEKQERIAGYKSFLKNLRGVLYYCTPHLGLLRSLPSKCSDLAAKLRLYDPVIARLNEDFRDLRHAKNWKAKAVGAAYPGDQSGLEILEASFRNDTDDYYTASGDFENVCKPKEKHQIGYTYLADLVREFVGTGVQLSGPQLTTGESSAGFKDEDRYVLMKRSFEDVQNAFKKTNIVVLSGGPGTGKTSFVRYYALQESQRRAQRAAFNVPPVFITCGWNASIVNKQVELLRKFEVQNLDPYAEDLLRSYRKSILKNAGHSSTGRNDTEEHLLQVLREALRERLKKYHAIIVLDDVWEPELIQNVLVQDVDCRLQYLVTTQNSALWNDAENVKIQGIDMQDALKILTNYADLPGGEIPPDCKAIASDIVTTVESQPLALATLGTVIRKEKSQWSPGNWVNEWKELRWGLMEHLKSVDNKPFAFGEGYPKTVHASMMSMVESLEEDEKALLYAITLFEGPSISEAVVQLFLMYIRSEEEFAAFRSRRQKLEARNLVQIETKYLFSSEGNDFEEYVEGASRTEDRILTDLSVHSLQQHFFLETNKAAIDEITSFLHEKWHFLPLGNIPKIHFTEDKWRFRRWGNASNQCMATLLCALFGVKSVKEKAMAKIGDSRVNSMCINICKIAPSGVTALLSLMAAIFKKERSVPNSSVASAVTKVFWTFLVDGELDDENISYLVAMREWKERTCIFLQELGCAISDMSFHRQNNFLTEMPSISNVHSRGGTVGTKIAFYLPSSMDTLVTVSTPGEEAWSQIRILANLIGAGTVSGNIRYNLKTTAHMLRSFITFLSDPNEMEGRRLFAAKYTQEIYLQIEGAIHDFRAFELFLPQVKILAELLREGVPTNIQQEVLRALRFAIQAFADPLHGGLTDLLMLEIPCLVSRVVPLLASQAEQTRSDARALADTLLHYFSVSDETSPSVMTRVATSPGGLETIVGLFIGTLAQDEHFVGDRDHTEQIAILRLIAMCGEIQIFERLTETPGFLERVVIRLSKGIKTDLCLAAATFLCSLSKAMHPSIPVRIAEQEGCLESLVGLLDEDIGEDIQTEALKALIYLSKSDNVRVCDRILQMDGLLERIVVCVTNDSEILLSKVFPISFCQQAYNGRRYFCNPFHLRRSRRPGAWTLYPFEDSRGLKASLFTSMVANPFMKAPLKNKLLLLVMGEGPGAQIRRAVEFALVVILEQVEGSNSGHDPGQQRKGHVMDMVEVVDGSGAVHDAGEATPLLDGVSISESLFYTRQKEVNRDKLSGIVFFIMYIRIFFFCMFFVLAFVFSFFFQHLYLPRNTRLFHHLIALTSTFSKLFCSFYVLALILFSLIPDKPMRKFLRNLCGTRLTFSFFMMYILFSINWSDWIVVLAVALNFSYKVLLISDIPPVARMLFYPLLLEHVFFLSFSVQTWRLGCIFVFYLVHIWWPRWTRWVGDLLFKCAFHGQSRNLLILSFIWACDCFLDKFGFFLWAFFYSFVWNMLFPLSWTATAQSYLYVFNLLVMFIASPLLDIVFPSPVKFTHIFSFGLGLSASCSWFRGSSLATSVMASTDWPLSKMTSGEAGFVTSWTSLAGAISIPMVLGYLFEHWRISRSDWGFFESSARKRENSKGDSRRSRFGDCVDFWLCAI